MHPLDIIDTCPQPHNNFIRTALESAHFTEGANIIASRLGDSVSFPLIVSLLRATDDVVTESILINYLHTYCKLDNYQILLLTTFLGMGDESKQRSRNILDVLQLA